MKNFLKQFLIFLLPVLILLAVIELYVIFSPSTFNFKAKYLAQNLSSAQTLILGSSHNQNALNPKWMTNPAINLANAGQDIQIDEALFFKFIDRFASLQRVILEMDYHTMEEKNDPDYFRFPWYRRFYGVNIYPVSLLNKISLYSTEPSFFNKLMVDAINPKKITYKLNDAGFILNDFPGVMEQMQYDSIAMANTAPERLKEKHTGISLENFSFNRKHLNKIIIYCRAHHIEVILLSTPMYTTYIRNEIAEKNYRRIQYADSLAALPGIVHYDFEKSERFTVHDFKNDDHLNSNGAKKFTAIIDSIIVNYQKK